METIEDILREMRDWYYHSNVDGNAHELIVGLADRIEAAHKRNVQKSRCERELIGDCSSKLYDYREAFRCIARSARAALKEEEV